MTVTELYDKLGEEIARGHGNLRVIANCAFTLNKGIAGSHLEQEEYDGFYLTYLNDVYYQSSDIELAFSDKKDDD